MPLPEPAARRHLHTRAVSYRGFLRDDGLWDIEAELSDTKPYEFKRADSSVLPPGAPVHGMAIRITVGDDMVIRAVATSMDHTPFGECRQGNDPMQSMVGERLGPGWRQAIEKNLGGIKGCTHLRELLFNMATVAYQAMYGWRRHGERQDGGQVSDPPHQLNGCVGWDTNGPVTARYYPQFIGWQRKRRPSPT